jgi:hypothetical protein
LLAREATLERNEGRQVYTHGMKSECDGEVRLMSLRF